VGWERGAFSLKGTGNTGRTESTWSGVEFANFQLGADFQVVRRVVIGPFVSFSVGEFDDRTTETQIFNAPTVSDHGIAKTSLHEWLLIGVRIAVMP
jgi:hypothetical protein